MIAVVDYDTGNLRSVAEALRRAGAEFRLTSDQRLLREAERVILPESARHRPPCKGSANGGLDRVIPSLAQPVLGICIGMQLMCLSSEEGDTRCMGIFPARVRRLPAAAPDGGRIKVPHVGWDTLSGLRSPLFDRLDEGGVCLLRTLVRRGTLRGDRRRDRLRRAVQRGTRVRQLLRRAVPPRKERGRRVRAYFAIF